MSTAGGSSAPPTLVSQQQQQQQEEHYQVAHGAPTTSLPQSKLLTTNAASPQLLAAFNSRAHSPSGRLEPDMFFYAGSVHAQTAYADAQFNPPEDKSSRGVLPAGFASAGAGPRAGGIGAGAGAARHSLGARSAGIGSAARGIPGVGGGSNASRGNARRLGSMPGKRGAGYHSAGYQQAVAGLGFGDDDMQSLLDDVAGGGSTGLKPEGGSSIASMEGLFGAHAGTFGVASTSSSSSGPDDTSSLRALGPFVPGGNVAPTAALLSTSGRTLKHDVDGGGGGGGAAGGGSSGRQRRRAGSGDRGEKSKSRRLSSSSPEKDSMSSAFHSAGRSTHVCALYLTTTDQLQCRFAVKNDEKESNQALPFVQANGYVEYKARYCKKRGNQSGYGHFHVAFLPSNECIYPFMHVPTNKDGQGSMGAAGGGGSAAAANAGGGGGIGDDGVSSQLLPLSDIDLQTLDRLEITVRLYQSFRGKFPVQLAKFGPDEMYHPLYITSWQDATLLKGTSGSTAQTSVILDPDGEYLRYVVQDQEQLRSLVTKEGVTFPCPVPTHPERLNDIGMLRMQVQIRLCHRGANTADRDHTVWVRMKVVQQLSGKKRKFTNMLRAPSAEWSLPPHPEFTAVNTSPQNVIRHVLGPESLRGKRAMTLLLSLAANISRQEALTGQGNTAFHMACEAGNLGLVRTMLQHELRLIRIANDQGLRPLHLAAKNGHTSIVQALLLAGARLETLTYRGETAADLARLHGFDTLSTTLARHQASEMNVGCENIFRAAAIGRTGCLKRLLAARPMINSCNPEGQTLLMLAALNNHPMAVSTLLEGGASITIPDRSGDTVLLQVAARGFVDVVTILVHHDPTCLSATSSDCSTALHKACSRGQILTVQILISCGADVNARDSSGQTPADVAAAQNHPCTTHLVTIAQGGEGTQPTAGLYPVSRSSGSLHHACAVGDVVLVRRLLYSGAHPNVPDANGDTPIKIAAKNGHIVVLDVLIASHIAQRSAHPQLADINVAGLDGDSPVHAACTDKSIGCLLVLLSSNLLKLSVTSMGGDTALHRAAETGLPVCTAFLLLAGADPEQKNDAELKPVDVAQRQHHGATMQVLSASRKDLVAVSKMLETKLGVPQGKYGRESSESAGGTSTGAAGGSTFSWRGFDSVLSRIWHETHEVRNAARHSHQEYRRLAKNSM